MNIYYIIALVLLVLILVSYGLPMLIKKSKLLNREGFNSSKKIVFTAYTADWCPHCVEFNSNVFSKLVNLFNGNEQIKITKVDCTNDQSGNTKTVGGNSLNGFPTLMINIYENGKMNEIQYDGNRKVEDIVSFIKNL